MKRAKDPADRAIIYRSHVAEHLWQDSSYNRVTMAVAMDDCGMAASLRCPRKAISLGLITCEIAAFFSAGGETDWRKTDWRRIILMGDLVSGGSGDELTYQNVQSTCLSAQQESMRLRKQGFQRDTHGQEAKDLLEDHKNVLATLAKAAAILTARPEHGQQQPKTWLL
jgi:hypothetical protein